MTIGRAVACAVLVGVCFSGTVAADPAADFALLRAAVTGDLPAVDASLARGASPNAYVEVGEDRDGFTPLLAAVFASSEPVVHRLLEAGADPRANDAIAPVTAVGFNDLRITRALVDAMGKPHDNDVSFSEVIEVQMGPQSVCLFRGLMVAELLEAIAEEQGTAIESPSMEACLSRPQDDPAEIAALLRKAGHIDADEGLPRSADQQRADLLVRATLAGHDDQVARLLAEGADPALPSSTGDWALPAAAQLGRTQTVQALLAAGAPADMHGEEQPRALVAAVQGNRVEIARSLLEAGADPRRQSARDWPMRSAVRAAAVETIDLLLHRGEDFFDEHGRSVLIGYLRSDYALEHGASHRRRLSAAHYTVPALIASRGFPMSGDAGGRALQDAVTHNSDLQWIEVLRTAGAPINQETMLDALVWKERRVVAWLAANGGDVNDREVLERAARLSKHWPSLILELLNAGARGPSDPRAAQQLRKTLVIWGSAEPLRMLMPRQAPPRTCSPGDNPPQDCAEAFELLLEAVERGFPEVVRVLVDAGVEPASIDRYGYTALHQLLDADVRKRKKAAESGKPAPAGPKPAMVAAAAALLETSPAALGIKTRWGATARDIAQRDPATQAWFEEVLSGSAGGEGELHRSIRADDEASVAAAVARGAVLDEQDILKRTPLTLALQLQRFRIAAFLLDHGAAYTVEPRNPAQTADIDYAAEPAVAQAFLLRMLREPLVDARGLETEAAARAALQRHQANARNMRDDVAWAVTCEGCTGVISLAGTERFKNLPLLSDRSPSLPRDTDVGSLAPARDHYWFRQDTMGPIPFELGPLYPHRGPMFPGREMILTAEGTRRVSGCPFDPLGDRACYPEALVENTNAPSNLEYRSSSGWVTSPSASVTVTQGGKATTLGHGESRLFDRSLGALDIRVGPVTGRVLEVQTVAITAGAGPRLDFDLSSFALERRMPVYVAMARHAARRATMPDEDRDAAVKDKTLAAANYLLAAKLMAARVPAFLEESLRSRARDLANLDERQVQLHRLLNASLLTPEDLNQAIARITLLLPQVGPEARERLLVLRAQVEVARASVASSATALNVLRGGFSTDIQRIGRDYQALILEYAQYVPNSELEAIVSGVERDWIAQRLQPRDVVIKDAAAGGRGAELRRFFGLPDPAP